MQTKEQHETFQVLKTRIETSLLHNDRKKYDQLRASRELDHWLQDETQQAWDAMNSTTDQANLSQRAELARDYLNPEGSYEEELETEESPEDAWLSNREQKVIVDPTSSGE